MSQNIFKMQQYISEGQNLFTKGACRHLLKICQGLLEYYIILKLRCVK